MIRRLHSQVRELVRWSVGSFAMPVPEHIAFVPDGNRRWARSMGFEDWSVGHAYGRKRVDDVISWCERLSIRVATLFVASRDNLRNRDPKEIRDLYRIVEDFLEVTVKRQGWEVRIIGRAGDLPPEVASKFRDLCNATLEQGRKHRLYLAIGYDGQTEIVDAANALLASVAPDSPCLDRPELITEQAIEQQLYAGKECKPDLVIRTGSELRMSGFMLWETTDSEICFSRVNWPDLTVVELNAALRMYRKLRFKKFARKVYETNGH